MQGRGGAGADILQQSLGEKWGTTLTGRQFIAELNICLLYFKYVQNVSKDIAYGVSLVLISTELQRLVLN